MPVPSSSQLAQALQAKNVSLECRNCGGGGQVRLDAAGLNMTNLSSTVVNTAITSQRHVPMALLICGNCGDTRFFHLETLGFKPPY
jgi:hypothetical protein